MESTTVLLIIKTNSFARVESDCEFKLGLFSFREKHLRPCLHGVGDPGLVGLVSFVSRSGGHKTKETYPTRPGSPTPCKQGLSQVCFALLKHELKNRSAMHNLTSHF